MLRWQGSRKVHDEKAVQVIFLGVVDPTHWYPIQQITKAEASYSVGLGTDPLKNLCWHFDKFKLGFPQLIAQMSEQLSISMCGFTTINYMNYKFIGRLLSNEFTF